MGTTQSRIQKPGGQKKTSVVPNKKPRDHHFSPKSLKERSPSSVTRLRSHLSIRRSLSPHSRRPSRSKDTARSHDDIDDDVGPIEHRLPDRTGSRVAQSHKQDASKESDNSPTSGISSTGSYGLSLEWMLDYGQIQLGKVIGHSSFGIVQEATLNGTKVAVKTVKLNPKMNTDDEISAFKKEAELNSKLRHPNIVLFMGICVEPKHVCIVTELMVRGNVLDLLVGYINGRPVKLDWSTRLQWALDTAMGMCYLHSLSPPMIHRDLKTTNLLVDRGMNVKICDFGMSRFKVDDKIMSAVGTVQFAAPEVLRNERYTEKADLFSFGTVLWELHTRIRVFKGLPQIEVYRAVIEGNMPDVPRGCPSQYRQLMKACWQLQPSKRPTFREAIDVLDSISEAQ